MARFNEEAQDAWFCAWPGRPVCSLQESEGSWQKVHISLATREHSIPLRLTSLDGHLPFSPLGSGTAKPRTGHAGANHYFAGRDLERCFLLGRQLRSQLSVDVDRHVAPRTHKARVAHNCQRTIGARASRLPATRNIDRSSRFLSASVIGHPLPGRAEVSVAHASG